MCIICDMQRTAAAVNHGTVAIAEGLQVLGQATIGLMGAIEKAKANGVTLDSGIETAYANASALLRSDEGEATGDGTGQALPEGMKERIAEVFSKATGVDVKNVVVCDSPEQAEAMLQKVLNPDKKSH